MSRAWEGWSTQRLAARRLVLVQLIGELDDPEVPHDPSEWDGLGRAAAAWECDQQLAAIDAELELRLARDA